MNTPETAAQRVEEINAINAICTQYSKLLWEYLERNSWGNGDAMIDAWQFEEFFRQAITQHHAKEKAELERRLAEAEKERDFNLAEWQKYEAAYSTQRNALLSAQQDNERLSTTLAECQGALTLRTRHLLDREQDNRRLREALNYIYYARLFPSGHKVEEYLPFEWQKRCFEALSAPENNQLLAEVVEVLWFYADPGTYHGMAVMFDPPTGGFDEDWSEDHGDPNYPYAKPGKRARAILQKFGKDSTGAES